jgi:hypothetical protein
MEGATPGTAPFVAWLVLLFPLAGAVVIGIGYRALPRS